MFYSDWNPDLSDFKARLSLTDGDVWAVLSYGSKQISTNS